MRAAGYVRVSTDEQAREGCSLDNQEARIRAYSESQE
jgi:DNA invertase Pin-like site-specific DNA recombinase